MYKNELLTPEAVVQSDTVNLTKPFKGLWILTADAATPDTVSVVTMEDTTVVITLPLRAAGAAYPIHFEDFHIKRINATNTTLDDAEMLGER